MVNENLSVCNIKILLIFVFSTLSTFNHASSVYYGPPLKVNAQLGVMNEKEEKLPKNTKSIVEWNSQVIYKPMSPLEKDLKNILDSYWNETDDKNDRNEYTSELPTKIMQIKNEYTNSILDSYIKHKEDTTEKIYNDRVHLETNLVGYNKVKTEKDKNENDIDRKFVNRSSIITKANFSYYHPIHKKYYNLSSTDVPSPVSLQHDGSTTSSMHLKTNYIPNSSSTFIEKKNFHNQIKNHNEDLAIKLGGNTDASKLPYKTTQIPFKPTGAPNSPLNSLSFYPTKKNINYSIKPASFGPQKPLFGHDPSIFQSFTKKSNHRIPHKVTHKLQQNSLGSSTPSQLNQYVGFNKPSKPQVHSNISPTGHIPSNNHPPYWSHISNYPHDTLINNIPNTTPPASYKPIFLQTSKPAKPVPIKNNFSYKPTSTTSSHGIEINKPTSIVLSNKPIYKPTYRPVVVEQEPQLVLETPSLIEEIVLPQEVVVPQELVVFDEPVTVAHEQVTDPATIPINSLQDVDRLLILVMEEFVGLYEHVISPFVNEMGNLLFGKSGENPISLFIIFGLPILTAALSAIGVGTVAIVAAAWLFPLISLLFVPQLQ